MKILSETYYPTTHLALYFLIEISEVFYNKEKMNFLIILQHLWNLSLTNIFKILVFFYFGVVMDSHFKLSRLESLTQKF